MKVLLDNIIYKKSNNGGISNYWYELTKFLLEVNPNNTFFIDYKNHNNFHRNNLILQENKIINTIGIEFRYSKALPVLYNTKEKFIFHSSYYRNIIGVKNKIEISTVHDFTHDYYFPFLKKNIHNFYKYRAIKRSNGIICVSNNTYKDLKRLVGINRNQKIEVIYNGVSDEFYEIKTFSVNDSKFIIENSLDNNFLLFIGSRSNYKNFEFVIELLKKTANTKLVVVGSPFTKKELKYLNKELLDKIILLTNVSNYYLNIIYNLASALIYPSNYEGFGIPIIEAMKAGCPVLSLNNSSISEIAPKGAILLNKLESKDFQNQLIKLKNTDFKENLIEEGFEQSKKFSWNKCMNETYNFYKEVFNQN